MRDLKAQKTAKVKANRRKKRERAAPINWQKAFRLTLRLTTLLASLLLVVSAGLLGSKLLFASDYFRVETVRVENQQRLSAEDVIALSEIRPGTGIFELDLEAIGRKIEEDAWIATARVERVFPRELVIRISEREPIAVINLGYLYYLDGHGDIFKLLGPEDRLDFPVVTGIDRRSLLESKKETDRLLRDAVGILQELGNRSHFGLAEVSELHIDAEEGFILTTLHGGIPVRLGFSEFAGKLDRLERIYAELRPRLPALKYIDLNVVDRVIVKVDSRYTRGNG